MARSFNYFVGLRYMSAKKQGFLSLISFISVAGIALGVTALIVVISVMNGFHEDIRDKIIGTNAHVVAASYSKDGIKDYSKKISEIEKIQYVVDAAPYFMGQVMLKYGDKVEGIVLWGIEPVSMSKVNKLAENMIKGEVDSIMKGLKDGRRGIIIGKELSKALNVDVNDELVLISPVFRQTPAGLMPRMFNMKIVGIFEAGMYDYDSTFAYVSIKNAQELFDRDDVITGIAIKADKIENAAFVAAEIHRKYKDLWARDWMNMNKNLFSALQIEKIVMFIILILIVLVAAFNIASTLIMIVMRKTKDIGILKSMGATGGDIMNIFIIQGVSTGVIGAAVGFVAGIALCLYLQAYPISMPGGGSIYYIDKLAVSIKMAEVIIIPFAAVLISFLATLYPSYHASRLDPVEAIRYE
ncbi:MAG TPA: lipoprotein-releasing ABC transporter permease subunit [bacterium]|nr:lipoprotein-releasing ABC transporter permease subunit [bacterium]